MDQDVEAVRGTLAEMSNLGLVALDELIGPDAGSSLGDFIPDQAGHRARSGIPGRGDRHILGDAINRLPDRERLVITLYYFEGLTLAEIGDVLGVTESRVCQIHAKSVLSLRNRMS